MGGLLLLTIIALIAVVAAWRTRTVTIIYPPAIGLLYRDGTFRRELPPGRYVSFDPLRRSTIVKLSLAELPAPQGELTVLSKDQFSFRLGLAPILKVTDPRRFAESQPGIEQSQLIHYLAAGHSHQALHSLLSAVALEVAATRTLLEILYDQAFVSTEICARLADAIPGAAVERVLLTSINLPPETRKMFTDVERAKMEGQAALERARGEQASLRALANAARLLKDNPALANLRLLQTLEASKGSTTVVMGNPPSLPDIGGASTSG
jgi:regulator of protease activity HflC (stomatin/prohibitin superfamily)